MATTLADASKVTPCYNAVRVDGQNGFVGHMTDSGLYAKFPGSNVFEFVPSSAIVNGKLTYTPNTGSAISGGKLGNAHGGF